MQGFGRSPHEAQLGQPLRTAGQDVGRDAGQLGAQLSQGDRGWQDHHGLDHLKHTRVELVEGAADRHLADESAGQRAQVRGRRTSHVGAGKEQLGKPVVVPGAEPFGKGRREWTG